MSEQDATAGVELSPEESAYFESGGEKVPAAPDPKPEPEKSEEGDKTQDKVEKVVPLAALHEERNRRKEIERRARDQELELTRWNERMRIFQEQQAREAPKPPDPKEDPFAYTEHVGSEVQQLKRQLDERNKADQAQNQHRQILSAYSSDAARFKAQTKDFDDAYAFLVSGREAELAAAGFDDPVARTQAMQQDELHIVFRALQAGRSPAEAIYSVAKARGYTPKAAEQDAAAKLDTIEKGQAANKSLSSAGGSAGGENITAQDLLKMSNDEFETWCNKNPAKAKRLMGG